MTPKIFLTDSRCVLEKRTQRDFVTFMWQVSGDVEHFACYVGSV